MAPFVAALNVAARVRPEPAKRLTSDVDGCRAVMDQVVKGVGAKVRCRHGSQWAVPPKDRHAELARMLLAICAVTAVLSDRVFGGRDPSRVDENKSRKRSSSKSQGMRDTDRWMRIRKDPGIAPRLDDPRVHDRWQEGLRRTGADAAVVLSHDLARHTGIRYCQGAAISMHDLLVCSPAPCQIPSTTKGSRGARVLTLIVPRSLWDRLLGYVDGERRSRGGRPLAELRRLAADPRRRHLLKDMPLFTVGGESGLTYDRLYRQSRAAAIAMDLYIADERHRATGIRRYVTFHMLRHEYVHSRMDAIEAMDKSRWPAERARLVAYMGWSDGDAMLEWYSGHHSRKNALAAAIAYSEWSDRSERGHRRQESLDGMESLISRVPPPRAASLSQRFAGL